MPQVGVEPSGGVTRFLQTCLTHGLESTRHAVHIGAS